MRACIFLLLFLSAPYAGLSKENYLRYHREIIRCEEQFLSSSADAVPKALAAYMDVFRRYEKPFAKDCFIALQLACSVKDSVSASYFFRKAFERGVEWAAITEAKSIVPLLSIPSYEPYVRAMYEELHPRYLRTLDTGLRAELIGMKNTDDRFKMRLQRMPKGPERDSRTAEYLAVLDSNTGRIAALAKQYGFPGDNSVGLMNYGFGNDGQQRTAHCFGLWSLVDQLYFHHGCCYFLTQKELSSALISGDILPAMYAVIYEWAHKSLKEGRPEMSFCRSADEVQKKSYNICPVIEPWNRNRDTVFVDKCREEIGLASLAHDQKKRDFQARTGMKMFFGMFDRY